MLTSNYFNVKGRRSMKAMKILFSSIALMILISCNDFVKDGADATVDSDDELAPIVLSDDEYNALDPEQQALIANPNTADHPSAEPSLSLSNGSVHSFSPSSNPSKGKLNRLTLPEVQRDFLSKQSLGRGQATYFVRGQAGVDAIEAQFGHGFVISTDAFKRTNFESKSSYRAWRKANGWALSNWLHKLFNNDIRVVTVSLKSGSAAPNGQQILPVRLKPQAFAPNGSEVQAPAGIPVRPNLVAGIKSPGASSFLRRKLNVLDRSLMPQQIEHKFFKGDTTSTATALILAPGAGNELRVLTQGRKNQEGIEAPGGHIKRGMSWDQGIKSEIAEEAGITLNGHPVHVMSIKPNSGGAHLSSAVLMDTPYDQVKLHSDRKYNGVSSGEVDPSYGNGGHKWVPIEELYKTALADRTISRGFKKVTGQQLYPSFREQIIAFYENDYQRPQALVRQFTTPKRGVNFKVSPEYKRMEQELLAVKQNPQRKVKFIFDLDETLVPFDSPAAIFSAGLQPNRSHFKPGVLEFFDRIQKLQSAGAQIEIAFASHNSKAARYIELLPVKNAKISAQWRMDSNGNPTKMPHFDALNDNNVYDLVVFADDKQQYLQEFQAYQNKNWKQRLGIKASKDDSFADVMNAVLDHAGF